MALVLLLTTLIGRLTLTTLALRNVGPKFVNEMSACSLPRLLGMLLRQAGPTVCSGFRAQQTIRKPCDMIPAVVVAGISIVGMILTIVV